MELGVFGVLGMPFAVFGAPLDVLGRPFEVFGLELGVFGVLGMPFEVFGRPFEVLCLDDVLGVFGVRGLQIYGYKTQLVEAQQSKFIKQKLHSLRRS